MLSHYLTFDFFTLGLDPEQEVRARASSEPFTSASKVSACGPYDNCSSVPSPEEALVLKAVGSGQTVLRSFLRSRAENPVILRIEHLPHPTIGDVCRFVVRNETAYSTGGQRVDVLMRGSSKCALPASNKTTETSGFSDNLDARTQPATCVKVRLWMHGHKILILLLPL